MFVAQTGTGPVVRLLTLADGSVTEIARPAAPDGFIRPTGWTPDGRRAVYMTAGPDGPEVTHVLDLETGDEVRIDAAFTHVSNDGARLVGLAPQGGTCVAPTSGGECVRIGTPELAYMERPERAWSGRRTIGGPGAPDADRGDVILDAGGDDGGTTGLAWSPAAGRGSASHPDRSIGDQRRVDEARPRPVGAGDPPLV